MWTQRRFTLALALALALPAAWPTEPARAASDDFECIDRTASAKPPPFAPPQFVATRTPDEQQPELPRKPRLEPVCPDGQVPVSKVFGPALFKGNPLIGPADLGDPFDLGSIDAYLVRKSLQSFEAIYAQERTPDGPPPPDPAGDCDGVVNSGSCYYYAAAAYRRGADGGGMTFTIERPFYEAVAGPGHTLAEIAVQGGVDDGDIVELGWNVSSDQYGDDEPHLFVFHWIGWAPTCYDGCGWQQWSATYFPGMGLGGLLGQEVYIGYVIWNGNWWAWFDNQWLGYFPGSEWEGGYGQNALLQWFGEVALSDGSSPSTEMGNGRRPTAPLAARLSTLCDVDAGDWVCWYRDQQWLSETAPDYYEIDRTGFGATRYGGPRNCGLGFELAIILPGLMALRARRRRRQKRGRC